MTKLYFSRVTPFGYLRVYVYFQLAAAFRRLSRPSSPYSAKAFTQRPFLFLVFVTFFLSFYPFFYSEKLTYPVFKDLLAALPLSRPFITKQITPSH